MFVRWKRRERVCVKKRPRQWEKVGPTGRFMLTAVLVRSERRDGKPRQKVVAHLASIGDDCIEHARRRKSFWDEVDGKLATFGAELRQKAEVALAAVVPRPTPEQVEAEEREFAATLARIRGEA